MFKSILSVFVLGVGLGVAQGQVILEPKAEVPTVTGLTWRTQPGVVLVPLRQTMESLGVAVGHDAVTGDITVDNLPIAKSEVQFRNFVAYVNLPVIERLAKELFVEVVKSPVSRDVTLTHFGQMVKVAVPVHRVEISIRDQWLRAYQGDHLVMENKVSTGRSGFSTPMGVYTAGPEFNPTRVSRKYDNAPMPWSVQVIGGIFIHGSASVPRYPASHGCIRMPLTGENPARKFYEWCEPGALIIIAPNFDKVDEMEAEWTQRSRTARPGADT